MTSVPDSPAVTWPLVAVSDDLTLKVYCGGELLAGVAGEPFSVAVMKLVPVGSVSVITAPVALVLPVLANLMVYVIVSPGWAIRLETCLSSTRLAGKALQYSERLELAVLS